MLDINLIRQDKEAVRHELEKRGGTFPLDEIATLDNRYRDMLHQVEQLRAQHNEASKQLGKTREKSPQLIIDMRQMGEKISSLQQETRKVKTRLDSLLLDLRLLMGIVEQLVLMVNLMK